MEEEGKVFGNNLRVIELVLKSLALALKYVDFLDASEGVPLIQLRNGLFIVLEAQDHAGNVV
jgi:hypothetical protein